MKMMMIKNKTLWMLGLSLALISCNEDNTLPEIEEVEAAQEVTENIALDSGSADFSNYVAIGASFTAGFSDGALFIASQENSFPNILASKFALVGGGDFNQPLMNDNIGGLLFLGNQAQEPRFYFDGSGPARLPATPTTEITTSIAGAYNNFGIPGAKSFHLTFPGYASLNPYFGRMATSPTITVLEQALAQSPTFFTLSEIGGNDVLGYALDGGTGEDQTGNTDAASYGESDITDPTLFGTIFEGMVTALTANGAKGVVVNVPYITSLANFTTVPYNPLDPTEKDEDDEDGDGDVDELTETAAELAAQIPTLNALFGNLNQIFDFLGETERIIEFSSDATNPVVIEDENLTDLSETIENILSSSTEFPVFVESFGLPAAAAPSVAALLGDIYGQARQATAEDLLVLASSAVIGETDTPTVSYLQGQGLSVALANQFAIEGLTKPLTDQWVLTPEEQEAIKTATDAYNESIANVAASNNNVVMIDLNSVLTEASISGLEFDNYNLNTALVTGGLISLDGVHLTSRGYALMANKILETIDDGFGSNFSEATNGLAKADDYPTNYSFSFR